MIENDAKVAVWAIPAPGGGNRAFCDRMNSWAQGEGQPGLGYIFWRDCNESRTEPSEHEARIWRNEHRIASERRSSSQESRTTSNSRHLS